MSGVCMCVCACVGHDNTQIQKFIERSLWNWWKILTNVNKCQAKTTHLISLL